MFYFDWTIILIIAGIFITAVASGKLKNTYARYARVHAQCGLTGCEVAKRILAANGINGVVVNMTEGELTDHYDPSAKAVNLSSAIYQDTSIASISVAAHECGHAIQDNLEYRPLRFRSSLVPIVNFGSKLAFPMILIGIALGLFLKASFMGRTFITIGIVAFSLAVLFQIVTLPVEYNASKRALQQLEGLGILAGGEDAQADAVLKAAALTYVAAAASSLLQLLRLIIIFRNND